MSWDHATELRERIVRFDDAIAGFRRAQEHMIARRRGAADHVMVELDDRLVVNRRTLEALERTRELAVEDLKRQLAQRDNGMMPRIVVVDDNPEGRFFFSKMVLAVFPRADIVECENSSSALLELRDRNTRAYLVNRATDVEGLPLVEILRGANATIPIIQMSEFDRKDAALCAGVTAFLLFDQAPSLGQVLRDILRSPSFSVRSTQ
jgi:CheY-like chemotaxis protein